MGWGTSPPIPRRRKKPIRLERGLDLRGKESLGLQLHQLVVGYETLFPITLFGVVREGGRAGSASHVGVVSASKLCGFLA